MRIATSQTDVSTRNAPPSPRVLPYRYSMVFRVRSPTDNPLPTVPRKGSTGAIGRSGLFAFPTQSKGVESGLVTIFSQTPETLNVNPDPDSDNCPEFWTMALRQIPAAMGPTGRGLVSAAATLASGNFDSTPPRFGW